MDLLTTFLFFIAVTSAVDGLAEYTDYTADPYAINRFFGTNYLLGPPRTGEVVKCCRPFKYWIKLRIHSLKEFWVYDGVAEDTQSGIKIMIDHIDNFDDMVNYLGLAMVTHLRSLGVMHVKPCPIRSYTAPLVSVETACSSESALSCDEQCTFSCNNPGYRVSGSTTLTCCDDGTFSGEFPTCQEATCAIGPITRPLRQISTSCPLSPDFQIPYGSVCDFDCDYGYTMSGVHLITCLADGRLSADVPTCVKDNSTSPTVQQTTAGPVTSAHGAGTRGSHTDPLTDDDQDTTTHTKSKQASSAPKQLGFLGFLSLVLLFPFAILVWKAYRRRQIYHEIVDDMEEVCLISEDILPDTDGYYTMSEVQPARPTARQLDPRENYIMDKLDKGLIFILNNRSFDSGHVVRHGSEIDVTNIKHVFHEIGYTPVVEVDLTAQMIRRQLHLFREKLSRQHTSVVLVFMSHGVLEGILGTDEIVVTVEEIKDMFSGKNCPFLVGKPKIMFFQACRGTKRIKGVTLETDNLPIPVAHPFMQHEAPGSPSEENEEKAAVTGEVEMQPMTEELLPEQSTGAWSLGAWSLGARSTHLEGTRSPQAAPAEIDSIPENADIFYAHATSEGYFSMRSRVNGSWFIQVLCEELIARAHIDDLDTIMTKVTRRVSRREGMVLVQGRHEMALQTPQTIKQGIIKHIYFLPKYPKQQP